MKDFSVLLFALALAGAAAAIDGPVAPETETVTMLRSELNALVAYNLELRVKMEQEKEALRKLMEKMKVATNCV